MIFVIGVIGVILGWWKGNWELGITNYELGGGWLGRLSEP